MPLGAERMSRVDTAWLRMDSAVNLMMINGVWLLTPAIRLSALRRRIADKLLRFDRFRQLASTDAVGSTWVEDTDFDIRHHVVVDRLVRAQGETERQALQRRCGELASTPLDPRRPLWMIHFVPRYEGGSALIVRVHHCIADGIALISVMLSLTDGGADPPPSGPAASDAADPAPGAGDWLADRVIRPLAGLAGKVLALTPEDLAGTSLQALDDARSLALMADDSPTRLKGKPSGVKAVAWGEPLALDAVKAIGKGLGCSVNDVLLACVAGALGAELRARGDDPAGKAIRAMVPVNLRPLEQAWKLGNHFGLAPLELPIGLPNPVERVYAVRRRMDRLKGSYQPLLAFGVLALAGWVVKPVQDALLGAFAKKATAVMTNVPGPREPMTFCGASLRQTLFWVPASGDIGVGVSILSYGGGVQFGLITDRALCDDPQRIVDRFEPEFDRLADLALMLPWPGEVDEG